MHDKPTTFSKSTVAGETQGAEVLNMPQPFSVENGKMKTLLSARNGSVERRRQHRELF